MEIGRHGRGVTPFLVVAALGVTATTCHPRPGAPTASPGGDALAAPRIVRYDTRLEVDVAARSIRGETAMRLAGAPAAGTELRFPRHDLVVDGVTVAGEPVTARMDGPALVIPLPAGSGPDARVVVAYHAAGAAGPRANGLVFGEGFVYSGFDTCRWMVCREGPGEKAAFGLTVTVPEGFGAVASGVPVGAEPAGPGRTRFRFEEERPYSPYLFGFAAGAFAEASLAEGETTLRFVGAGVTEAALLVRFGETGRMLRFLEEKAGVPLPQAVYTQVLVPGSEAQEKSTFSILGRDEVDPILTDPTEDWAIVHELAHQWWGNLVTRRTWSDFWLNEGVTSFLVAAWKEARWGRAAYERELDLFRKRRQRAVDAGFDVPLAYTGTYPSLGVRRAIQYAKGALFLDLLRRELGERAFWAGLKRFTRENAGGTVVSADLRVAFERESGRDLGPLFREWVGP